MMTSSNGNIFRVTFPRYLCEGESTGYPWIPLTKDNDAELMFFYSAPEQTVEQTIETLVIALIMTSLQGEVWGVKCGLEVWSI